MSVTFLVVRNNNGTHEYLSNDDNEVNVSNVNFASITRLLDIYNEDYCGSLADYELHELRTKISFVLDSVKAMPELDNGTPTEKQGNWIQFGIRPQYYTDRLDIVEYGGRLLGGCSPFNYTEKCWCY